mmetsp:Transcript_21103/g.29570  ORF Transcript_21103/g.29570 Transcript_21103/m.29570 type:complete len:476 (+) Transcript_21103:187-1614(+)
MVKRGFCSRTSVRTLLFLITLGAISGGAYYLLVERDILNRKNNNDASISSLGENSTSTTSAPLTTRITSIPTIYPSSSPSFFPVTSCPSGQALFSLNFETSGCPNKTSVKLRNRTTKELVINTNNVEENSIQECIPIDCYRLLVQGNCNKMELTKFSYTFADTISPLYEFQYLIYHAKRIGACNSSPSGIITSVTENPTRSPTSKSNINIQLLNMGNFTQFDNEFNNARKKWESVITHDLPDLTKQPEASFDWFNDAFPGTTTNVDIDDVLIGYSFEDNLQTVDGANILGFAGPIFYRLPPSAGTISGMMVFDKADFIEMGSKNAELVILHEMGHALGIGTLFGEWECNTKCPEYSCDHAKDEYEKLDLGDSLQLELGICSHWAESNFEHFYKSEIMTPLFEKNKYQPLSRVTIGALEDLGYNVNYDAADPWELKRNLETMSNEAIPNNRHYLKPTETFFLNETMFERPTMKPFY